MASRANKTRTIASRTYTTEYFTNVSGGQSAYWVRDDGQHYTAQKLAAIARKAAKNERRDEVTR